MKHSLGLRLESTISGLTSAKEMPQELIKWVCIIEQSCPLERHTEECKKAIIQNVQSGNNKSLLLWLVKNYYIDLIALGYSTEFLYQSVIRYFDNRDNSITSSEDIITFLDRFDGYNHSYEFFVVADTYKLDNLSRINPQIGKNFHIEEIDEEKIIELKRNGGRLRRFYSIYEELKKRGDPNIKMLSCKADGADPYSAFMDISQTFDLAQFFEGYFKHKSERKLFFDILLVNNQSYTPIKLRKIIPNRPYIDQAVIDKRIEAILNSPSCPINVFVTLFRAMDMHLDALNCKNAETMLRTFWTALEALFFAPSSESEQKESTKYCLLHIIQKTYILKQFRLIYEQMTLAIADDSFWEEMNISGFRQFVDSFMSLQADDPDFKKFTSRLSENPLLRSRLYWFRKEMSNCKSIQRKIEEHFEKVSWQIDRIYRTRNLSTHAGVSMPYIDEILFNLHNYFDYTVNYIICKLENGNYIHDIPSLIFEAKNDNQIHLELLKKTDCVTAENLQDILFGPDHDIISYDFEVVIAEE